MRRGWRPLAGALVAAATLAAPLRAQAAGVYTGLGFDTCVAPPLTTLTAWLASPYRAVGVYIGGVNQGCPAGTPTPSWIAGASAGGWSLVPLYVGPQAPCVTRKGLAKIDAATAGPQGAEAADDAAALPA